MGINSGSRGRGWVGVGSGKDLACCPLPLGRPTASLDRGENCPLMVLSVGTRRAAPELQPPPWAARRALETLSFWPQYVPRKACVHCTQGLAREQGCHFSGFS